MKLPDFFAKMKRYQKNAELIFDAEEPVGRATDLVMPRRHWFRRDRVTAHTSRTSLEQARQS